jgi:hypothetical protein
MKLSHTITIVSAVLFTLATGPLAMADKTVDDFESYKSGQIIGKTYNSEPWCRFGKATNDNIAATGTDGKVISGRRSGQYGATWPNTFGAVRFVFKNKTDLNQYIQSAIKVRSDNSSTNTRVKLAISNGETTYASSVGQSLSTKIQHLTFSLDPADMVQADGSDSYTDVVTNATMIGLDFVSSEGRYTEAIIFDDFELKATSGEGGGSEW